MNKAIIFLICGTVISSCVLSDSDWKSLDIIVTNYTSSISGVEILRDSRNNFNTIPVDLSSLDFGEEKIFPYYYQFKVGGFYVDGGMSIYIPVNFKIDNLFLNNTVLYDVGLKNYQYYVLAIEYYLPYFYEKSYFNEKVLSLITNDDDAKLLSNLYTTNIYHNYVINWEYIDNGESVTEFEKVNRVNKIVKGISDRNNLDWSLKIHVSKKSYPISLQSIVWNEY